MICAANLVKILMIAKFMSLYLRHIRLKVQPSHVEALRLLRTQRNSAKATTRARTTRTMTVAVFIRQQSGNGQATIRKAAQAQSQAITHWKTTTNAAHLFPSSRLIEAMAATHGV